MTRRVIDGTQECGDHEGKSNAHWGIPSGPRLTGANGRPSDTPNATAQYLAELISVPPAPITTLHTVCNVQRHDTNPAEGCRANDGWSGLNTAKRGRGS